MMQAHIDKLMQILKGFRTATENKEWETVGNLDQQFREQVELAVSNTVSEEDRKILRQFLQRAQSVYELVKAGAEKNKAEIAQELTRLSKEQKAVASYQKSMQLR